MEFAVGHLKIKPDFMRCLCEISISLFRVIANRPLFHFFAELQKKTGSVFYYKLSSSVKKETPFPVEPPRIVLPPSPAPKLQGFIRGQYWFSPWN